MYKFAILALRSKGLRDEQIYVSLERRMKCGVGKCGHCQINNVYVCQEGPVFNYAKIRDLKEAIQMSRPKVAFFDFTSCEGCQLSKLNLEDDLLGILELVEIVNFREAISDRREDYEIAFVEGSISTPHCVERIHRIRRQAKILVALGRVRAHRRSQRHHGTG